MGQASEALPGFEPARLQGSRPRSLEPGFEALRGLKSRPRGLEQASARPRGLARPQTRPRGLRRPQARPQNQASGLEAWARPQASQNAEASRGLNGGLRRLHEASAGLRSLQGSKIEASRLQAQARSLEQAAKPRGFKQARGLFAASARPGSLEKPQISEPRAGCEA
jgi:hypothetical protein